jgi:hypothetical protein
MKNTRLKMCNLHPRDGGKGKLYLNYRKLLAEPGSGWRFLISALQALTLRIAFLARLKQPHKLYHPLSL